MKRPARERSSGSASVMSSPLKVIVPSVTSSAGWPMIALARVDLPEPFGPHQRVDLALLDVEVEAAEDLLVLDAHVQVADLQLSQFHSVSGVWKSRVRRRCRPAVGGLSRSAGCANSTSSASVVPGEGLGDAALHPGPEQLGRTGVVAVVLVRAEHFALGRLVEALHRGDLPFQRLDHRVHRDLLRRLRQAVAAVGAPGRGRPGPPCAASRPGARGRRAAAAPPRRRR